MISKPDRRTVSARDLIFDPELNPREENRYKIEVLAEQIVSVGRILDPLVTEATDDKKKVLVLKGNRRGRAANWLLDDHQRIINILVAMSDVEAGVNPEKARQIRESINQRVADLVDHLGKLEVLVHKGLTQDEREEIVMDHGTQLALGRTETVKSIWRKFKAGKSEAEIIRSMYEAVARYTGNVKKLAEVEAIKDVREKERKLHTWLHGTVGNQILKALQMGEYVREQFILSRRSEDQLLKEGEKVEMFCSTSRITELSSAITEDKNTPEGWDTETGGPKFNALVEKFKKEDLGVIEPQQKRPTVTMLEQLANAMRTTALRKAFLRAAGDKTPQSEGLDKDDERLYRDETVMKQLASSWDKLPKELKDFAHHVMSDIPSAFELYLKQLTAEQKVA